ncbi:MAG: polyphenol oxidase family protein [Acidimicrobiales bacterium]
MRPAVAEAGGGGGVELLRWPGLLGAVDAAVTTRHGGVSTGPYRSLNLALHVGDDPAAVLENRRRAVAAFGARLDDLVLAEQVHGAGVAVVAAGERGRGTLDRGDVVPGVDALVTVDDRVVLTILVADCVPLVLVDPDAGVLGCVHAGWRGTVGRVVERCVETMVGLGARPAHLQAGIGPAIAATAYPVGADVVAAVRRSLPELADAVLSPARPGSFTLDLWEATRRALVGCGLDPGGVHLTDVATGDRRLFSDRRARPCGRFGLLARLAS